MLHYSLWRKNEFRLLSCRRGAQLAFRDGLKHWSYVVPTTTSQQLTDLFQVFQVEKEGLQTHHVSQANIPTAVLFPPFSCNCDSQKR